MDDKDELQDVLKDVLSKGLFNDADCRQTYSGNEFMGNSISEHMAVIDSLGQTEDFPSMDTEKVLSDLKIEPSETVKAAMTMVKHDTDRDFDETSLGLDASALEDARRLKNIYLYYSEAWRIMYRVKEELDADLEKKNSGKWDVPEWDGMCHRCGFVGYSDGKRKVCNECAGRHSDEGFRGIHAPFIFDKKGDNSKSITKDFRAYRYGNLIDTERFGYVMLDGVYNLQNRRYSELY